MTPLEIRKSLGLTQEQLAKEIGYTQRQVTRIESGHAQPGPKYLQALERLTRSANGEAADEYAADMARLDAEFRNLLSDLLTEYRRDPETTVGALRALTTQLNADVTARLKQATADLLAQLDKGGLP